ncbi:Rad4 beta-hairpin domain 3 [Trinorchestia longiramus]|nr:Rad4 beta-hairpin domain 3 [Trinorchestia longiramus]
MACRRSSRVVNQKSCEIHSEPVTKLKLVKGIQRSRPGELVKQKLKDASIDVVSQPNKPEEVDFSLIEKKIFEGTGLSPSTLSAKSTKDVLHAKNVQTKVSKSIDKNLKIKLNREQRENIKKDSKNQVALKTELTESTSKKDLSFEQKIKDNPPVTKKGCLKTHNLNPDQIVQLVKTHHPKASEILPKLTIENLRASSKAIKLSKHKSDVAKENHNTNTNCKVTAELTKNNSISKKVCSGRTSKGAANEKTAVSKKTPDRKATPKVSKEKSKKSHAEGSAKKRILAHKKSLSSDSEQSDWEDVGTQQDDGDDMDLLMERDEAAALSLLAKRDDEIAQRAKSGSSSEAAPVQIELDAPSLWGSNRNKKRKSQEYWMMEHFRHGVNRNIRENYLNCHKVHLLLLLGHGMHVNGLLNSEELLAAALSIITNKEVYPPKRIDLGYLEKFSRWYAKKISRVDSPLEKFYWVKGLQVVLKDRFEKKQAKTGREFVFMFVLLARALGMNVRLIMSLKPMHWRPSSTDLFKRVIDEESDIVDVPEPPRKELEKESKSEGKNDVSKRRRMLSSDGEDHSQKSTKKKNKKVKVRAEESDGDDDHDTGSDSDFDITFKNKKRGKNKCKSSSGSGGKKSSSSLKSSSSGSSCKRSASENSPVQPTKKKKKLEELSEWAEVYVEEEERWVCVDVIRGKIHCAAELASRAPAPVAFVTAFNGDLSVKDVTKRYVRTWLAFEDKLRGDSQWWKQVLAPYAPPFSAKEKAENKELEETLRQQPLPKTIAEYKNHKMFVLQRHLLKFEALYPPNPDPIGFVKGEAVYPRDCVHLLHSRDIWKKQGMSVKVGEEPYKIVKARPKWDRATSQVIKDLPLEIFGPWQVEYFQPPVAKDGRVPRNEYGNVELFQEWMLPVGTVHFDASYEDLNRVARKLKIDCASAMVGFDTQGSTGPYPVFNGYVVCTEFKDILLDAWREEMDLKKKRLEAKRQRCIYDNWKRLILGMLVKHHVWETYGQDSDQEATPSTKTKSAPKAKASKSKKKIKQADIDAQRPGTEEKVQLGVDLSSDTVAMARKSYKDSLSSRGVVRSRKTAEDEALAAIVPKKEDLILDSDEEVKETEEEKKEKLRKILAWNNSKLGSLPELSDDSDAEGSDCSPSMKTSKPGTPVDPGIEINGSKPSRKVVSSDSDSNDNYQPSGKKNPSAPVKPKKSVKKGEWKSKLSLSGGLRKQKVKVESELSDEQNETQTKASGRPSRRRTVVKKSISYKESEDSDISLDESDLDDKTYKPVESSASCSRAELTPVSNGALMLSEESDE